MNKINPMLMTDFYKTIHHRCYAPGTTETTFYWTARHARDGFTEGVVFFGLQEFLRKLVDDFDAGFFKRRKQDVINEYKDFITTTLGADYADTTHIEKLYDLGSLPLTIKALPEGTVVPMGCPMVEVSSTHSDFFWLPGYLETLLSCNLWFPITCATTARKYRSYLEMIYKVAGEPVEKVDYACSDFSMRGMTSLESATMSGSAHLLFFKKTANMPAIDNLIKYYHAHLSEFENAGTPSTEHSVMSSYGVDETRAYMHLLREFPKGPLSIVSDTYNLWDVIDKLLPLLKTKILAREGTTIIRPDCYDDQTQVMTIDGWKYFADLTETDKVAQVLDDETYEYIIPENIIKEQYSGEMIHFTDFHKKLDLLVTPNHRMIFSKNGEFLAREAQECKGQWNENILRSAKAQDKGKELTYMERLRIMFQADGSFNSNCNGIRASFSKQRKINRLKWILDGCSLEYKIYELKDGKSEFSIKVEAKDFQKDFDWVNTADLCSNWCAEFIEELSYWDATIRNKGRVKFDTTNKKVSEKVELIALSAGYGVFTTMHSDNRKECFSDVYTSNILKNNKIGYQSIRINKEIYNGMIYCVKVPTGRLIVKRKQCTAVCGNSGDPVTIICGDNTEQGTAKKGVVEALWDLFGGTTNAKGYKVLDSHIKVIYGDAITLDRCKAICENLMEKGFSPVNVVFGIGSYTYQYVTRDTYSFKFGCTHAVINDKDELLYKDPITDKDKVKKSLKGLVVVYRDCIDGSLKYKDGFTRVEQRKLEDVNLMRSVFFLGGMHDLEFKHIRKRCLDGI